MQYTKLPRNWPNTQSISNPASKKHHTLTPSLPLLDLLPWSVSSQKPDGWKFNISQGERAVSSKGLHQGFLSTVQSFISSYNCLIKLNHQRCSFMPVDSYFSWESTVSQNSLYDASGKGCAVQSAVLFRNWDVSVNQRLLLYDVVGLVVIVGLLQFVGFLTEQCFPDIYLGRKTYRQCIRAKGQKSCSDWLLCPVPSFSIWFL